MNITALILQILTEIVAGVLLALLIRRFLFALILVKGSSMRNTLHNYDLLLALRRPLFRELKRYDIVICRYPKQKGLRVKRIVGLPGERIELIEGKLFINGEEMAEPFELRASKTNMAERQLGAKEYFLLGDNRLGSRDSRAVGPINEEEVLAVASRVLLPLKHRKKLRIQS